MFRNYLIIALRNIFRDKFYALLNILGLSIGIAGFIIVWLWVSDETGYDKHFTKSNRIYRVETSLVTHGKPEPMATTDPRITEMLRKDYPEIENSVRMYRIPSLISTDTSQYYEENTFYSDSTFFDIFSFQFITGNPRTALLHPNNIVITEEIAIQLFGNTAVLDKTVFISNRRTGADKQAFRITGVIKENATKSHFHPGLLIPKFKRIETFELTYLLLKEGYDPQNFTNHIWPRLYESFFKADYAEDKQDVILDRLQPVKKIHLSGNKWEDLEPNGNLTLLLIFSVVGFLILLIACFNYINLSTARSFDRAREVGVRKVLGATFPQLIAQFLIESITLSLLSLLLALSMVEMILPAFNSFAGKSLELQIQNPVTVIALLALAIIVGFIAGVYPAFFLSSFQPAKSIKGTIDTSKNKPTLRKVLVVIQFSLSIVMLIATMVIAKQLEFVKKQDLGFDSDRVLLVDLGDQQVNQKKESFKAALLANPNIVKVAASYNIPSSEINHTYISFETPDGMEPRLINSMFVDYDYLDVMGLRLVDGRNFRHDMSLSLDTAAYLILNESAVKLLGWNNPVGKKIETGSHYGLRKGTCIGIVKDFHVSSLHDTIAPLVLALGTLGRPEGNVSFLSIKIKPNQLDSTIKFIADTYLSYGQGYPFKYSFLDKEFNKQYLKEDKEFILFNWFAGLSIFISCLGLIGLASFFTKQRTREICIRKIAGASTWEILILLSVDFVRLIFLAFVIASPVAYFIMRQWLLNFAYHIEIGWLFFAIAGFSTLCIVIAATGVQALIAAAKNPATVLKYE